jgi:hypothetical protein
MYTRYSCPILIKIQVSLKISEKYSNIKFNENPNMWEPSCSIRIDRGAEGQKTLRIQ